MGGGSKYETHNLNISGHQFSWPHNKSPHPLYELCDKKNMWACHYDNYGKSLIEKPPS